jgi:ribonuclease E
LNNDASASLVPNKLDAQGEAAASPVEENGASNTSGERAERGEREGGRRRGRGGRDRNRREFTGETHAGEVAAGNGLDAEPHAPTAVQTVEAPSALAADLPSETSTTQAASSGFLMPTAMAAADAPAVVAVTPAPSAPAAPLSAKDLPAYELPLPQLLQVAQSAGLLWVNSDADKVRAAQEAMAREPQPVHVPRVITPVVLPDEGPLVLVETRKDLSQVKLPFEQPGA